jgi:hypothetical protein
MGDVVIQGSGGRYSVTLNDRGNFQSLVCCGETLKLPTPFTFYEINGTPAEAILADCDKSKRSLRLSAGNTSALLTFEPERELILRVDGGPASSVKSVSVTLAFPIDTEFHLAEHRNVGRVIDRSMPVGDFYSARLTYNFFLAGRGSTWLRFMTKHRLLRRTEVQITRHPQMFLATFTWHSGDDLFLGLKAGSVELTASIGFFSSMDQALADWENWLQEEKGFKKLEDNPEFPRWIHNVRLILTVDMMRSYGEISHDYVDVSRLAEDLARLRCPEGTLFYLPGWNGAYDSTGPTYRPHPALGGEEKFRQMMEVLHSNGYRAMIHTLGWGIDPYHPAIEDLIKYVRKEPDGSFEGYKIKEGGISRRLHFRTDRITVDVDGPGRGISIETVPFPDLCEAYISIGGFSPESTKIRMTLNNRTQSIPSGSPEEHEPYDFPFPFLLHPGENRIELMSAGKAEVDWRGLWYEVRSCFVPKNPFQSSTHPILTADTGNPGWIQVFVDEVAGTVRDYGIDAVHVDATVSDRPPDSRKLLQALQRALPDVPIGGEWCAAWEDVGFWAFCQGATQSLIANSEKLREPGGQGSLPVTRGLAERYDWLNRASPIVQVVQKYMRVYPHLCAANGFVPIGKVCDIYPKRLLYTDHQELLDILEEAPRLSYIPALRVNYREHGLDSHAARYIEGLAERLAAAGGSQGKNP